jgi:hypothetical protein
VSRQRPNIVKALTILQPYAHLIAVTGEKWIENRTWSTPYRGMLAIHAGKARTMLTPQDVATHPTMAFGAIVGFGWLEDCVRVENLPVSLCGHVHAHGPWCWVLRDVYQCEPLPYQGAQGLWILPPGVVLKSIRQVPRVGPGA